MRHFTSREFNQDRAAVSRASRDEPVVITNRGKPVQVLLSYEEFRRMGGQRPSIADLLSFPEVADIDFELPPRSVEADREVHLG